ncbi:hypothetical protein [Halalkalicoccus jeotgali]|uniref:Uncharacterized protein n=1 Tax=Halalkalicoccus jeotgali (strain DSM 18796 / CECT 7217 / JCM 14584 / KCTC 4019 / B3) TaxID=795797 RepID=D8J9P8_HALJB|nr:hypothetical protein [Halalkalicoccus jeotgali]ADJ14460.1 hypothetical protein HacjB3_05345 [Halalkalicoccus jeotgali B3]ELY40174.1 hypothetical protein C497_03720 [Halalkalicoccus jeotgali B3]
MRAGEDRYGEARYGGDEGYQPSTEYPFDIGLVAGDARVGAAAVGESGHASMQGRITAIATLEGETDVVGNSRGATLAAQYPDLIGTVSPTRDSISERERLESYLKAPFRTPRLTDGTYEATEFGALVGMFSEMAQAMVSMRNEMLAERYVDLARGRQLDRIGALVLTPRRQDERDDPYRIRIKAEFLKRVSGGTIDEIRQMLAVLLDTDREQIRISEPFDLVPATMVVDFDAPLLDQAPVEREELREYVLGAAAAGVEVELTIEDPFRHRPASDDDPTLHTRGYNEAPYKSRYNR